MILKNKLTKEKLDIPYSEFRKKFAKEINDAFESYRKTQLNKYSWNFKDDNSLEFKVLHQNFVSKLLFYIFSLFFTFIFVIT